MITKRIAMAQRYGTAKRTDPCEPGSVASHAMSDEPERTEAVDGQAEETAAERHSRLAAEREHRLGKVDAIRQAGGEPYPYRFDRTAHAAGLHEEYGDLPPGTETQDEVAVAGRLLLIRRQGKLVFGTLRDGTGLVQLFVSRADIGDAGFESFDGLDLGDWVGVHGTVMTTRRGELSVKVRSFEVLAKAVRPLPDKWKGLTDTDTRYRQRYVDLIVNEDARRAFEIRHATIASARRTMAERGFVEVEGPVLQLDPGGAHARPFVTHHNALGQDMYLRIALELHLKRLVVGGLERVFEIGRVFRNEGISPRHNPEFTMLEAYQALADYTDMMELTEAIVRNAALDATGSTVVTITGEEVDLADDWPRKPMCTLVEEVTGARVHPSMPLEELRELAATHDVAVESFWGPGKVIAELYDELAEPTLVRPTFVIDYPVEVSPLARLHRRDPHLTERFELVVGRRELANAFSELNDPVDQRARFAEEQRQKELGDLEAGVVDEDYLRALEFGLPPTGGLGIGMDRLVMLLTGMTSIKEVILFPTLRPEVW
jgi:lysyl-tRNA synthetase class 2